VTATRVVAERRLSLFGQQEARALPHRRGRIVEIDAVDRFVHLVKEAITQNSSKL